MTAGTSSKSKTSERKPARAQSTIAFSARIEVKSVRTATDRRVCECSGHISFINTHNKQTRRRLAAHSSKHAAHACPAHAESRWRRVASQQPCIPCFGTLRFCVDDWKRYMLKISICL